MIWTVDQVRALAPDSRPTGSYVPFQGGMLDGQVRHLLTTVDDGPVPFDGCANGCAVRNVYRPAGWQPDRGVWLYALSDW